MSRSFYSFSCLSLELAQSTFHTHRIDIKLFFYSCCSYFGCVWRICNLNEPAKQQQQQPKIISILRKLKIILFVSKAGIRIDVFFSFISFWTSFFLLLLISVFSICNLICIGDIKEKRQAFRRKCVQDNGRPSKWNKQKKRHRQDPTTSNKSFK